MIGVAKANSMVDIGKLEYCVRDDLNQNAPRVLGVLRPVEVEVTGSVDARTVDAPYFPPDVGKPGSRPLPVSGRIYIDREDWSDDPPADFKRLAPGRTVRLRHGYAITADEVVARDAAGNVTKLRAHVVEGGKGLAVIHWVDAATSVTAEARLYGRLFKVAQPEEGGGDFLEHLDPASLEVIEGARVEQSLAKAEIGSRWQLERVGYFRVDEDTKPGLLVLNRISTLREAVVQREEKTEKKENAKAKTRPKSKSPAEYREEARNRDPFLRETFEAAKAAQLPDDQADLLSGDLATARLFRKTLPAVPAALAAKWIINELPRALGGREVDVLEPGQFIALMELLERSKLTPAVAKTALAEMITTGKRVSELTISPAKPVDLGPVVDAVIAANPDKAAQYKAGKTGLLGFFVGQVMKTSPGADAAAVNQAVRDRLG
jgi:glutaminyl-tRNA synthetase